MLTNPFYLLLLLPASLVAVLGLWWLDWYLWSLEEESQK